MAGVTYRTWTTGEVVTAAMLNEQIRDNGDVLKEVAFNIIFDGSGATLTTDMYVEVIVPLKMDLAEYTATANQTGIFNCDVWRQAWSSDYSSDSFVDSDDSITASAPILIDSDTSKQDTTLTGWTKGLAADDILRFQLENVTNIKKVTISMRANRF